MSTGPVSAMSDFPRGWTLSNQQGAGTAASVTVAAIAGVVHVLDSFTAKAMASAGGAVLESTITLTSSDGVFAAVPIGVILVPAASSSDEFSASGLDLAAGPGASLTIAFNVATPAGDNELLVVQGHDI